MPGEAAKKQKQNDVGNQQEERRHDERRQTEQNPQEERRQDDRRQGPGSANTTMRAEEQSEYGQEPSRQKWQGENAQSGTSQAQKGEGRTPNQQTPNQETGGQPRSGGQTGGQQTGPAERHEQRNRERSTQDFGESHDPAFGGGGTGAGGKVDSTQRDMGQTGQNMRTGAKAGEQHPPAQQQGPYGPSEKHRGPEASGKPLMDDWGKSDKH